MTDSQLAAIAFSGDAEEYRQAVLEDLVRDEPSSSVFDWASFLAPDLAQVWKHLDLSQRLVAYIAANHLSKQPSSLDG